jgi:hypothetical protein
VPRAEGPGDIRTLVWRRVSDAALERFVLHGRGRKGWRLSGTIVALEENGPAVARYDVDCDPAWRTAAARVVIEDGSGRRRLDVEVLEGRWFENGRLRGDLSGAVDLDLQWSPSTNTLPIRRLSLRRGAWSGALVAAWVRFPALRLEPLTQEYRRVGPRRYRYRSRTLSARLDVDADGLVVDYEGGWRRVESAT